MVTILNIDKKDCQDIGMKCEHEWKEYYDAFSYFSKESVRDGCHPRKLEHPHSKRAIVLVHGLTDSPYYLTAIADIFHHEFGYNVYLPLLHCHGLRQPMGMKGVHLEEWKKNVLFSLDTAAPKAEELSIGGFSTGGTLSLHAAVNNPLVNSSLYLFSTALDLAGGILGNLKEKFLRSSLTGIIEYFDKNKPLIGVNPFRYDRVDMDGAKELAKLIKETDILLSSFTTDNPFPKNVFAAHSESDTVASIEGIKRFTDICRPDKVTLYRIPKKGQVSHASLLLKEPVYAESDTDHDAPLESANPFFDDMMDTIRAMHSFHRP